MRIDKRLIVVMGTLALMINACGAVSAAVPRVEEMSQSSVIGRRAPRVIESALDDGQAAVKAKAIKEAMDAAEDSLLAVPQEKIQKADQAAEASFLVRKVQVKDSLLLTDAILAPFIKPFEGRQQTMSAMQGLADQITAEYRRRGYLSSQAYIAPQEVADGVFTISVLEGRIGRITFEGNRHYSSDVLRRYCVIHEGDFFSYQALQNTVFKLNAHPDRVVRAIIRSGDAPGQTDIIFKIV